MEKKTIRSGAPFLTAGLAVLVYALVFGIGSVISYLFAAAALVLGFAGGKKIFPDRVIEVERAPQSGDAQADALIAEARAQLAQIERADDAIADPVLSAQIADITATCRRILARLEEQPDMISSLRTFLRYYLPSTLKLLSARAKLEQEVESGDHQALAARLREAMGEVQTAFHKQLNALNEFRFINLESEMDVLADMLRQDGLMEDEPAAAAQEEKEDPFASVFAGGK